MFNFIPNDSQNTEFYISQGTVPFSWYKPRGIKFISFIVVGGGGGGAGPAGTGNGGGGTGGAISSGIFPAALLPDLFYLRPGAGGAGGASGAGGSAGSSSFIGLMNPAGLSPFYLLSASGGAGGSTTAAAFVGGTIASPTSHPYSALGIISVQAGPGSVATTSDIIRQDFGLNSAGSNGGAFNAAGRSILSDSTRPSVFPNLSSPIGSPGLDGIWLPNLLMGTGGSGGGGPSGTGANGTRGGNGAYGSGGGGGSGASGATPGSGGNGGSGFIAISYW